MNDINILDKLINFKTDAKITTHKACNDYIVSMLKSNGWKVDFVNNENGNKKNIVAVLNGDLKDINNGLLLSGHIDTVTTTKELWATDPYKLTINNDLMFGLGVADMKYFTASILANLKNINKLNLKKPLVFALTSDEETVMEGIIAVSKYFKKQNLKPEYALIGEPNSFKFSNSNKGFYEYETEIIGKACHSSNPNGGINAIYIMSNLVLFLENLAKEYNSKGTTINVGVINGGKLCNIVPDLCKIRWDIRTFSRKDLTEIESKVNEFLKEITLKYNGSSFKNSIVFSIPVFEDRKNPIFEKLTKKYGYKEEPYAASTEAGYFQELGIDCAIFGVGDIKDAHAINEKLSIKDFREYQKILLNMIEDICC